MPCQFNMTFARHQDLLQSNDARLQWNLPGLHFLCFEAAGGGRGAAGLLAELHQGLVVLLLLLLLLFVT